MAQPLADRVASLRSRLRDPWVQRSIIFWSTVCFVELSLVALYLRVSGQSVEVIRYQLYPFVWINVGLWAAANAEAVRAARRARLFAGALAVGYFVVLFALPGNLTFDPAGALGTGFDLRMAVPGWGPILSYEGSLFRVRLVPFETVGYGALAYLVYLNLVRLSARSLAGLVAFGACIGCTVPVLVPILGILGGTGTTLASTAYAWSYDLGTALFVGVVYVLYRTSGPP